MSPPAGRKHHSKRPRHRAADFTLDVDHRSNRRLCHRPPEEQYMRRLVHGAALSRPLRAGARLEIRWRILNVVRPLRRLRVSVRVVLTRFFDVDVDTNGVSIGAELARSVETERPHQKSLRSIVPTTMPPVPVAWLRKS